MLSAAKSTNTGHVAIRSGPQSDGRRWAGLMKHVDGWVVVPQVSDEHLVHQDALWEEGQPAGAV